MHCGQPVIETTPVDANRFARVAAAAPEALVEKVLAAAEFTGERRVVKLIQTMPENPRERNFWQLIAAYRDKIPDETYDYVLSIFTAAVIGENPHLFGFDFDNPLSPVPSDVKS